MKVNVIVKPKEAVLDPQGNAVRDAMRHLGMPEVESVRIGKPAFAFGNLATAIGDFHVVIV